MSINFIHTVTPEVHLNTSMSNNVAKTGSSVNVICTAESYPLADDTNDYLMKHPHNTPIGKVLLPGGNGVEHRITTATKERDAGNYECSVNVTLTEYPGKPLDSEVVVVNLRIYGKSNLLIGALFILHVLTCTRTMNNMLVHV